MLAGQARACLDWRSKSSAALSSSLELDEVLSTIARRLTELFDVWECDVYEYRPLEGRPWSATAMWSREITAADHAWIGTIVRHRRAARPTRAHRWRRAACASITSTTPTSIPSTARRWRHWGEQSVLSVPLTFNDEAIGVLTLVEKRWPRRFTAGGARAARPARRARGRGDPQRAHVPPGGAAEPAPRARWSTPSRAMSSTLDLDELLQTIARAAGEALGTAECAINALRRRDGDAEGRRLLPAHPRTTTRADWVGRTFSLRDYPGDRDTLYGGEIKRGEGLRPHAGPGEPALR